MSKAISSNLVKNATLLAVGILASAAWLNAQNAPPRPICTSIVPQTSGSCEWNPTNGVGAGVRVVLSDRTGGHGTSKTLLLNSLTRLSQRYGFTLTRIASLNDITDTYLANAKVVIFSNGDGNLGGSIPDATVRTRVENFVNTRGWGVINIHAACAFIDTWPWQQDVCVQQYNTHNPEQTNATIYVEDSTYTGTGAGSGPHGRRNPSTSFMLAGLPNRVAMTDEWYSWRGNPRTTHQYNRTSNNKIMMLAADEATYSSVNPRYPGQHFLVWTHTLGAANGIAVYNSTGHIDTYQQGGTVRAYGDTLLWRQIRYAAKDWRLAPTPVFKVEDRGAVKGLSLSSGVISLTLGDEGRNAVSVTDVSGKQVYSQTHTGVRSVEIPNLKRGIYFVKVASNKGNDVKKVSLY